MLRIHVGLLSDEKEEKDQNEESLKRARRIDRPKTLDQGRIKTEMIVMVLLFIARSTLP